MRPAWHVRQFEVTSFTPSFVVYAVHLYASVALRPSRPGPFGRARVVRDAARRGDPRTSGDSGAARGLERDRPATLLSRRKSWMFVFPSSRSWLSLFPPLRAARAAVRGNRIGRR